MLGGICSERMDWLMELLAPLFVLAFLLCALASVLIIMFPGI